MFNEARMRENEVDCFGRFFFYGCKSNKLFTLLKFAALISVKPAFVTLNIKNKVIQKTGQFSTITVI
jgi:hypothetical protein